jgi:FkbM family methyltransferase
MQKTKLGNYTVYFENAEEYHSLKRDVFSDNSYQFETTNLSPVIIDAGANIGLATLYFKKMFPQAKIIAVEPIPETYHLLELNVFENNLADVYTYPLAISHKTGQLTLHTDVENNWHSTASIVKGNWTGTQNTQEVVVETKPLSYFITEALSQFEATYIDLLKLDIEGAEQKVLVPAKKLLKEKVKFINCEFHPHSEQSIAKVVRTLEEVHFDVTLFRKGKEISLDKAKGLVVIEAKNQTL